jgi:hypothetical protein
MTSKKIGVAIIVMMMIFLFHPVNSTKTKVREALLAIPSASNFFHLSQLFLKNLPKREEQAFVLQVYCIMTHLNYTTMRLEMIIVIPIPHHHHHHHHHHLVRKKRRNLLIDPRKKG